MNKIPYWQWGAFIEAMDDYIKSTIEEVNNSSVESYLQKKKHREVLDSTVIQLMELVEEPE